MRCNFLNCPCELQFARYQGTGNIAIQLTVHNPDGSIPNLMHGEPMCMATTNLAPLPDTRIAIKNWSECTGMVESLVKAGVIEKEACDHFDSGFVSAPVHKLTTVAISELQAAGVL